MKIHYCAHKILPQDCNLDRINPVQIGDQQFFGSHGKIIV